MLTSKSRLLTSKSEMLASKSLFLMNKSEMLTSKSLFLTSKSEMLTRKSNFLITDVDCQLPPPRDILHRRKVTYAYKNPRRQALRGYVADCLATSFSKAIATEQVIASAWNMFSPTNATAKISGSRGSRIRLSEKTPPTVPRVR